MKRLLWLPLILILSSCASHLNQQQCETISWKTEGYQDAASGKLPRDLTAAIQDCAKFNLKVDTKKYMQGWKQGARAYCTPDRELGFLDGQAGKSINAINYRIPVCTRANINLNLKNYRAGRNNGLKTYCTYANGAELAKQAQSLPNVCPRNLKKRFRQGWLSGKKEYCNQPANAFALGKEGKPYPAICPANSNVGFKSEYDRGQMIGNQIRRAQARINEINSYINSKRFRYSLKQTGDGFYHLTRNKSAEANAMLTEINNLVRERKNIERDVFRLQVTR